MQFIRHSRRNMVFECRFLFGGSARRRHRETAKSQFGKISANARRRQHRREGRGQSVVRMARRQSGKGRRQTAVEGARKVFGVPRWARRGGKRRALLQTHLHPKGLKKKCK